MAGRGSITLLHVRGIRVGIDYSWFLVLFLVILWLSAFYRDVLGAGHDSAAYALAVASALLFFASILLHELGHAFVAARKGIGISGITLWMFGGITRMERDAESAATEFQVAAAGPLVTAAIIGVCVLVGTGIEGSDFFRGIGALFTSENVSLSGIGALFVYLAWINGLLLAFNMVPAFPLDGGRIARAIAWWRTGDRLRATKIAAQLGRAFAYLLIGVGVLWMLTGDLIGGVWFALVGVILNGSARGALIQSQVTHSIEGLHVSDVMDREPVALGAEVTVEEALDEFFLRYRWPWFPVVDAGGRFRGLLSRPEADSVPETERRSTTVEALLDRADADAARSSVNEDEPLEAVLSSQALRTLGALAAVDADGRLRGVLTADAVGRALRAPAR